VHADRSGVLLLTERARRRLPAIVDDLMDRQLREVPEFFVTDDPAYRQAVRSSTQTNSELMLEAVCRPSTIPRALPPGPRLEADVAAQYGAPVQALLRTYRLGQHAMLEHLLDELDHHGADGIRHAGAALREATRTLFDYMETVMPLVAGEYSAERARLEARPDLRRLRLVQAVLAGDESVDLGYPLAGPHVALVASDDHAETAVARAAHALDAPSLALRAAGSIRLRATLEAWFAAHEHVKEAADALGVASRTVSYRLRRAETLMGSTIAERRAELEAALRVVRLFEDEPPPPDP